MNHRYLLLLILLVSAFRLQGQDLRATLAKKRLVLAAHRGGLYHDVPENSMALFRRTTSQVRFHSLLIELDIRRSRDGTLWISHDSQLERVTNGMGEIGLTTDSLLRTLKLRLPSGKVTAEPLPTFKEALALIKSTPGLFLMLDVKDFAWEPVAGLIREEDVESRCLILTFKRDDYLRALSVTTKAIVSFLVEGESDLDFALGTVHVTDRMAAYVTGKTPAYVIERIKAANIPVVTDASEARHKGSVFSLAEYRALLLSRRPDILVTDYPIEVSRLLRRQ